MLKIALHPISIRNLTHSFSLCISILLLVGCQSTSSPISTAIETPTDTLESTAVYTATSSEKQMLRSQSGKVLRAGTFLTIMSNLSTNAISSPLQKACLTGATGLKMNEIVYSLKQTPPNSTTPFDA